jgi:hypothetical protein
MFKEKDKGYSGCSRVSFGPKVAKKTQKVRLTFLVTWDT